MAKISGKANTTKRKISNHELHELDTNYKFRTPWDYSIDQHCSLLIRVLIGVISVILGFKGLIRVPIGVIGVIRGSKGLN